jgi:hypothetical protein
MLFVPCFVHVFVRADRVCLLPALHLVCFESLLMNFLFSRKKIFHAGANPG